MPEMKVVVVRFTVYQGDIPSGYPGGGSIEAVVDSHFQSPNIEIVEVAVQGSIAITCLKMPVVLFSKPFSKEIPHVTKDYEY